MSKNRFEQSIAQPDQPKQGDPASLEILPNQKQQDKIIAVMESGDFKLLNQPSVPASEEQRSAFLEKINQGAIGAPQFQKLLLNIEIPFNKNGPVGIFDEIAKNKQMRAFLAEFTKGWFYSRDELNPTDLIKFIDKFPEPFVLEQNTRKFLRRIEQTNSLEKRKQYEVSLRGLMRLLYGKRYDYYEQIKLLQKQAEQKLLDDKIRLQARIEELIRREKEKRKKQKTPDL